MLFPIPILRLRANIRRLNNYKQNKLKEQSEREKLLNPEPLEDRAEQMNLMQVLIMRLAYEQFLFIFFKGEGGYSK